MVPSYLLLLIVLTVVGALVCALAVGLTAWSLLHPPRMTDAKALYALRRMSPGDLGMRFEEVTFHVRDERTGGPLRLAGWWIPALPVGVGHDGRLESPHHQEAGRCVVLLHGYADAKVGAIAWAPVWRNLGFHILALDLRAHGESEGAHSTAGFFERHDVAQAIDQLRAERPAQTRQIVLFGASSGAAVALATAALPDRDPPDGVVLDSPYADFRQAAAAHMEQLGLPARLLASAAISLAERWSGADFGAVRPVDLVARVACPVLAIVVEPDPYLPPEDAAAVEAALYGRSAECGRGTLVRFRNAGHLMATVAAPAEYERCIGTFAAQIADPSRAVVQAADDPFAEGNAR